LIRFRLEKNKNNGIIENWKDGRMKRRRDNG